METSDLEGFDKNIGYFKISNCDDDSSGKSSDSETETETET